MTTPGITPGPPPSSGGATSASDLSNGVTGTAGTAVVLATSPVITTPDIAVLTPSANVVEQRNGINPQTFRVDNTYTDTSNYERGFMRWNSDVLEIGSSAAGSGITNRSVAIYQNGAPRILIRALGVVDMNNALSFYAPASGVGISGSFYLRSPSNGVLLLTNWGATDIDRVQFGGTTSAFPALKRSGTAIQARLADDSANAPIQGAAITAMSGTAIPAGGTAGAGLMVSSTANFGLFFGSGAPTLSAAKGSLYLRSDGSTTNDRAYINTDGGTTWTALTTAA